MTLTRDQEKTLIAAMAETQKIIDRAMSYLPKFRDYALIDTYKAILAKQATILSTGEWKKR